MYIYLFIISKIVKVKVVIWLECVPFVDVIYRSRRGIPLSPPQGNIFHFKGRYSAQVSQLGTTEIYDIELTLRDIHFPQTTAFDAATAFI